MAALSSENTIQSQVSRNQTLPEEPDPFLYIQTEQLQYKDN
jgi:hypothetical protein